MIIESDLYYEEVRRETVITPLGKYVMHLMSLYSISKEEAIKMIEKRLEKASYTPHEL